jgi:hypothetical protein
MRPQVPLALERCRSITPPAGPPTCPRHSQPFPPPPALIPPRPPPFHPCLHAAGDIAARMNNERYLWSVVPSLLAWPLAMMEPAPASLAFTLLLPALYLRDRQFARLGYIPSWCAAALARGAEAGRLGAGGGRPAPQRPLHPGSARGSCDWAGPPERLRLQPAAACPAPQRVPHLSWRLAPAPAALPAAALAPPPQQAQSSGGRRRAAGTSRSGGC